MGPTREKLRVLDIGCNDGTLLSYYPKGTELFGVDPSDIAKEIEFPMTLVNTLFPSERALKALQGVDFDIVTSIAMFYDLEEPIGFARSIASLMKPGGFWIVEMSYLPLMLLQNSFDTICHEHLEYYSLTVLEHIFASAGLRVFRAEINDINGGSIRCFICHDDVSDFDTPANEDYIQRLRLLEFEMALDTDEPYARFRKHITDLRDDLKAILKGIRQQNKRIHIYGASTKGNVLLQWYGIDNTIIEAAAERNPYKVGGKTLGTYIPMISEEESRSMKPDYYLVLPWHFKREFLHREYETIRNGVTFIFPLPQIDFVNADNIDQVMAKLDNEPISSETWVFDLAKKW